jgi:hypothetical protein
MTSYDHRSGLDMPPWWTAVPILAPFGIGKWIGGGLGTASRSFGNAALPSDGGRVEGPRIPWLGIAAIVGVGAILVYGISRASKASERTLGPIQERAGRLVGNAVRARGAGAGKSGRLVGKVIEGKLLPV